MTVVDWGGHFLLGDKYADGEPRGECAWTLLTDNLGPDHPNRVTRLERMPYPRWWGLRSHLPAYPLHIEFPVFTARRGVVYNVEAS